MVILSSIGLFLSTFALFIGALCFFFSERKGTADIIVNVIVTSCLIVAVIMNIATPIVANDKLSAALPKDDYVNTCSIDVAELAINAKGSSVKDLAKHLVDQGDNIDYCSVFNREASYYYIEVVTLGGDKETFALDKYELCDILEYIKFDNTLNVE